MSYSKRVKTEHSGPKGSGRHDGWYGTRYEAKTACKKVRRRRDREAVDEYF